MAHDEEERVVSAMFRAVENRDLAGLAALYHPQVEFRWPPSLPYGGTFRDGGIAAMTAAFAATWGPLQPGEAERRMDPRIIASRGDEVVALYHQRGVDRAGRRIDCEVLGLYRVRDGALRGAQMFYLDPDELTRFLAR